MTTTHFSVFQLYIYLCLNVKSQYFILATGLDQLLKWSRSTPHSAAVAEKLAGAGLHLFFKVESYMDQG